MDLKGKIVVITGAAQGFGRTIALDCASEHATVIACDLASCDETVRLINASGAEAIGMSFDVTDYQACEDAINSVVRTYGRVDGVVNCGALYGALHFGPFEVLDPNEWDLVMKVNVKGVWHMCKAVSPHMKAAGGGSIVNISSNSAHMGPPMMCHYVTSKAALFGMTRTIASELGPHKIRVNAVCPGAMNTPGSHKVAGDNLQAMLSSGPPSRIKVFLEPEEVSGTIKFLLSDDSKLMTGQILTTDGGMTSH